MWWYHLIKVYVFINIFIFHLNQWKLVVCPLFKKPSLILVILTNYHPVLNLPFLDKVVERAAAEQLQFPGSHIYSWSIPVQFLPWTWDEDCTDHSHGWSPEAPASEHVSTAVALRFDNSIWLSQLWSHDPFPCQHRSSGDCLTVVFLLFLWSGTKMVLAAGWSLTVVPTGMWCARGSNPLINVV